MENITNSFGYPLVLNRVYHTTWAYSRAMQWALREIDLANRRVLLQPPRKKGAKKFWTDMDSLRPTNRHI